MSIYIDKRCYEQLTNMVLGRALVGLIYKLTYMDEKMRKICHIRKEGIWDLREHQRRGSGLHRCK